MLSNVVLSVVVPTYNMEAYLPQCLTSVCAGELAGSLEILVVNDGSKDGSLAVASSFRDRFPNIVSIIDKPNGNYGSCVNAALGMAQGRYVRLLDADDWFDSSELEQFVRALAKVDVDVVHTPYVLENEKTGKRRDVVAPVPVYGVPFMLSDARLHPKKAFDFFRMHSLTYRTELLRSMRYRQTEGVSYTDMEYVFYPLSVAKTLLCLPHRLYHYRIGRVGQTVELEAVSRNADHRRIIVERMLTYVTSAMTQLTRLQRSLLTDLLASYYWSVLVIQKPTDEALRELERIDGMLRCADAEAYDLLGKTRCLRIAYVANWRASRKADFPWRIYRALRKCYASISVLGA